MVPVSLSCDVSALVWQDGRERYARPHDIAVARTPQPQALAARFVHGATVGPRARLEFELESPVRPVHVELSRERYDALGLVPGERAWLTPTRDHVFATPP